MSTNPADYHLPPIDLPEHWKYGIDEKGRIYYYHIKIRESQWEPPIKLLPLISDDESGKKIIFISKHTVIKKMDFTSFFPETYSNESTTDTEDTSEDEMIQTLKMLEKKKMKNLQKISMSLETESAIENMGEEDLELKIMNNMLIHPVDQAIDISPTSVVLCTNQSNQNSPNTQNNTHKKKKSRRGLVQTKLIKVQIIF